MMQSSALSIRLFVVAVITLSLEQDGACGAVEEVFDEEIK